MNPMQQQQLMEKLQKQNQQAGFDTTESVIPSTQQPVRSSIPQDPAPQQEEQMTTDATVEELNKKPSTKERIEALEQELGERGQDTSKATPKAKAFIDEYGNETWYVKNLSNGHISISDLDITIKRGRCDDLLKFANIEDIKKSRDLRAATSDVENRVLLKRLTPEEYLDEKQKEVATKRKIQDFKNTQAYTAVQAQQQQTQAVNATTQQRSPTPQTPRIRPAVLSKLEKLRLSSVPESAHLGLSSEEFVEWALTEDLSSEELDFIATHPNVVNNSNIRTAVFKRKSELDMK